MPNHPQMPVEEIDLMPHPLDAWRAALNALIAVAPGVTADIAWHLKDAREKTLVCRDFSAASQGEAKLIDRLMLLGAGKLMSKRLNTQAKTYNELGFTHQAPLIGIDLSTAGRCKRLSYAMGISSQSVYRRLLAMAETEALSETEALNRLEAMHRRGADQ